MRMEIRNLHQASCRIIAIYRKAALCPRSRCCSTFASSIFTIIVRGRLSHRPRAAIAREYWLESASVGANENLSRAVSLMFPDMTAFIVDDIVVGNAIALGLFLKTAALGVTYIAVYFLAGYFLFAAREL